MNLIKEIEAAQPIKIKAASQAPTKALVEILAAKEGFCKGRQL